jgi:hypothetical protein
MIIDQLALFSEMKPKKKVQRDRLITTVSYDQQEIMDWIEQLFLGGGRFECDPTYSIGVIWRDRYEPRHRFDIRPQSPGVIEASADKLPFEPNSLSSLFFDPPFLIETGGGSIMKNRFPTIGSLWNFYAAAMIEFERVLKPGGVFAFKCQDLISSGRQVPSQWWIMNMAIALNIQWEETFILINDNPIVPPTQQKHGRKVHSYFIVFKKVFRRKRISKKDEGRTHTINGHKLKLDRVMNPFAEGVDLSTVDQGEKLVQKPLDTPVE